MDGIGQTDLLDYLLGRWREQGPVITVVEGFSGTGKTDLALRLKQGWNGPKVLVTVPEGHAEIEEVLFDIASGLESSGSKVVADQADGDYRLGIKELLKSPALIIIDDFDELLIPSTRLAESRTSDFLYSISRLHGNGRILLLTNQTPADCIWLGNSVIKTMAPPEAHEAEHLLIQMLKDRGQESQVPHEEIPNIVTWLGRNPRAMKAFVASLRTESFETLIGIDPETWQLRDQVKSQALLAKLEKEFLRKTINRLDSKTLMLLENISIYRKPFTIDAIRAALPHGAEINSTKEELVSRFLLGRNQNWFSLNPIARQLCLAKLCQDEKRERLAHTKAGDHFVRHVQSSGHRALTASGGNFVEAKFHLLAAKRYLEFENLAGDFRRILLKNYQYIDSAPKKSNDASTLLHVLMAALQPEDGGYGRMRGILAQLLNMRHRQGDDVLALRQAKLACREIADPAIWVLRVRLTAKLETKIAVAAIGKQALKMLSPRNASDVSATCIEALVLIGDSDGAIQLFNDSIGVLPTNCRTRLYSVGAFALRRTIRRNEAITFLAAGYRDVGMHDKYSSRLLEEAAFFALQDGDANSLRFIKSQIDPAGRDADIGTLCDVLDSQIAGDYLRAAKIGNMHLSSSSIAAQTVFSWLVVHDIESARKAIMFDPSVSNSNCVWQWLNAVLAICRDAPEIYAKSMEAFLARPLNDYELSDPVFWLKTWDLIPERLIKYPAFYFPVIPSRLSHLDRDLRRKYGSPSELYDFELAVLPIRDRNYTNESRDAKNRFTRPFSPPSGPNLYINYTNNEGEIKMGDEFNIKNKGDFYNVKKAGHVGPIENAYNSNFQGEGNGSINPQLIIELRQLVADTYRLGQDQTHAPQLTNLEGALEAAERGDRTGLAHHLSSAGRWALDRAGEIGTGVLRGAISQYLGIN